MLFAILLLIIYAFYVPTVSVTIKKRPLAQRFWDGIKPIAIIFAVDDVLEFLRLGGLGCAAICFEWWAFEIISIFCRLFKSRPDVFIGAHAVLFSIGALFYMYLSGCASSASIRTGLALGTNRPRRARLASQVALFAALVVGFSNAAIIFFTSDILPALFDKDDAVRKVASNTMPVLAASQMFDAWNAVSGGTLRGAGRQATPAAISFSSYYIFGIPSALIFAFALKWNLTGLWIGLTFGLICASAGYMITLLNLDWSILAKEAVRRVSNDDDDYQPLAANPNPIHNNNDDDIFSRRSSGSLSLKNTAVSDT
uniref:Polysaccharide biosynthesis protein C-terminal domain-containing protein n=1 Tax=Aureoumbra lagunensis TaxID=44058 RepID=A0A7S3JTQ6_9STRA|mmetsp:Transcript_17747/g.21526  ORF Transcript_17747/g.21526 Transcript_17747/m.21526 type:complete len:312 (+) Transcript_17747:735-1670(+)